MADTQPPTRSPLMTLDEVLARLVASAADRRLTETETLSSAEALGRVLAAKVRTDANIRSIHHSSALSVRVLLRLRPPRRRRFFGGMAAVSSGLRLISASRSVPSASMKSVHH